MTVLKLVIHIRHMLQELLPDFTTKGVIFSYNEALVNFVNGNGPMVKGVRHFEIHQWLYSKRRIPINSHARKSNSSRETCQAW